MKKTFITKLLALAASFAISVFGSACAAHDVADHSITASAIETYKAEAEGSVDAVTTMSPGIKTETVNKLVADTAVETEDAVETAVESEEIAEAVAETEETVESEEVAEIAVESKEVAEAVAKTEETVETEEVAEIAVESEEVASEVMVASYAAPASASAPASYISTSGITPNIPKYDTSNSMTISTEGFVVKPAEDEKTEVVEEPEVEETEEIEEPEVQEPAEEVQDVRHYCNCGWTTTDYEALKWHMLQHALNGEAYSYSTHVGNIS